MCIRFPSTLKSHVVVFHFHFSDSSPFFLFYHSICVPRRSSVTDFGFTLNYPLKHSSTQTVFIITFPQLAYFAFLFLFSYIILTDFNQTVKWQEWLLICWVATLYAEEFRQVLTEHWLFHFIYFVKNMPSSHFELGGICH